MNFNELVAAMRRNPENLSELRWSQFERGQQAMSRPLDAVASAACEESRVDLVLGEPSVLWFSNYVSGFLAAQDSANQELAATQRGKLSRFERWLQGKHGEPSAKWHRIIRVYAGQGDGGVLRAAELWAEWLSTVDPPCH